MFDERDRTVAATDRRTPIRIGYHCRAGRNGCRTFAIRAQERHAGVGRGGAKPDADGGAGDETDALDLGRIRQRSLKAVVNSSHEKTPKWPPRRSEEAEASKDIGRMSPMPPGNLGRIYGLGVPAGPAPGAVAGVVADAGVTTEPAGGLQ